MSEISALSFTIVPQNIIFFYILNRLQVPLVVEAQYSGLYTIYIYIRVASLYSLLPTHIMASKFVIRDDDY